LSRGFFKISFKIFLDFFEINVISRFSLTTFQQPIHYITFFSICQEVFQNFFLIFS